MKYLFSILTLILLLMIACAGSETGVSSSDSTLNATNGTDNSTVTEIPVNTVSIKADYDVSDFSSLIFFHKTKNKILIDYNFFPAGSDVCQQKTYNATTNPNGCQQASTIVMPCEYQTLAENDLLSINLSAPTEEVACDEKFILDVLGAEFTVDGLVFGFSNNLTVFVKDFDFVITRDGFVDNEDDDLLLFETLDVNLEEILNQIIAKRAL